MKPPVEPKKEDCCNSGCTPCIFDVYEEQLQRYKSYIERGETSTLEIENAMSQLEYKRFDLVKNINICQQHRLLLFKQHDLESDKKIFWHPGEHFLVKYQSENCTCTRAYTPVKLELLNVDYDFAIIVKMYENGLVSSFLCDSLIGDCSFWRGPYGHYQMESQKFCRLVMIAQGTGITPLYSIMKKVLDDEKNIAKITLLYCCKSIDTILLREDLYSFRCFWNFEYMIYLSVNPSNATLKYKEPISSTKLTASDVLDLKPFSDKDQFLLCGSEDFETEYTRILQQHALCVNIVRF